MFTHEALRYLSSQPAAKIMAVLRGLVESIEEQDDNCDEGFCCPRCQLLLVVEEPYMRAEYQRQAAWACEHQLKINRFDMCSDCMRDAGRGHLVAQ